MMSPAPQCGLVSSWPDSSPRVPLRSYLRRGGLRSPAATGLGPPPTPTPPLGRSRVPVGNPFAVAGGDGFSAARTSLRSPTPPVQPRTSFGALSSTGTPLTAEAGLEPFMPRTTSLPPLPLPFPVQESSSFRPPQPATIETHPPTPAPEGLPPTPGVRLPMPRQPPQPS